MNLSNVLNTIITSESEANILQNINKLTMLELYSPLIIESKLRNCVIILLYNITKRLNRINLNNYLNYFN